MNIIDERNTRTVYRKLKKREYDERMKLSATRTEAVRLLDEGMVVDAYGNPLFYIKKGVLQAYYDALPDDYVGTINLGHMNFVTFPFILGTWTKRDLHLIDIGDGRQALFVDLHLDEDSLIVKELRRQDFTLGVSAEFSYHEDERNTKKYNLQILDKIFIGNFGIVGEAGNVNSSDIQLQGGQGMTTMKDLVAAIESAEHPNLEEVVKKLDALGEAEEAAPEAAEEPEKAEEPAEEEKVEEEAEAAPEAAEEATEASEEAEEGKALAAIASVMEGLAKENAELKAQNEKLTAKLAARDKAEAEFLARFKNVKLSVSTKTESVTMEEAEAPVQNVFTDGIGEI